MITAAKLLTTLSYAEQQGLFKELEKIYGRLPGSACQQCARCCAGPPPGYLIEYLNAYRYLRDKPREERQGLMERVIRYYFLELVEPSLRCPFAGDDNRCLIHPVRPFTCRAYGLLSKQDYEKMDGKNELEELALKYKQDYGIDLPREIVEFKLPYCELVQPVTGKQTPLEVVQISIGDIGMIESSILPMQVVEEHHTFVPVATHLALTVLSEGARTRRPKVMKQYLEQGNSELLDGYVEKWRSYEF
ncbi:MAG: YkgJ family cysteine cluster protein [Bacillota bacterium]